LRLVETLSGFLKRLGEAAKTLDVLQRQRIVRLLVKEVLARKSHQIGASGLRISESCFATNTCG
jgi:hypothetical protein